MIQLYTVYKRLTLDLNTYRLKLKDGRKKNICHANSNRKGTEEAILKSDKADFKDDKKQRSVLYIKDSIQQCYNDHKLCTSNSESPKHMRQKWTEFKKESSAIIAGDFNTQLLKIDRTTRQR